MSSRRSEVRRALRMFRASFRAAPVSGTSRRLRCRWALDKLVCGLVTGGRCWWGKPFREYERGRRKVRCRLCRATWSNWEDFQPDAQPRKVDTWTNCPYDDVRSDPKARDHFEKVCAAQGRDPATAPWQLVYISLEPPPPEAIEMGKRLAEEHGW